VASTPYQGYTGELTAGVNSQQQAGIGNINANANYASPFISQAAGLAGASSAPIDAATIAQYQNPYTQQVIDATTAQMGHDNQTAMANLQGNQIAQGALGGNATGVAKGILAGQQGRTEASTVSGLYSNAYQQALGAAQHQQQTGLAGANALANYGISGQNAALAGANAQIGAGTLQQQTQQAQDAAQYGQFTQQQAYPYQQLQWLAGLGTGVGSNLGGTSNGQTTGPAPNQTAQWLGAGLSAASMFLNRGGAVRRADGGGVAGTPWAGAQGWIPTMQIHGGSGAPHGSAPGLSNAGQTSPQDIGKVASGITGLGGKMKGLDWGGAYDAGLGNLSGDSWGGGSFRGGDAWGGSSSNMLPGLDAGDFGEGFAGGGGVGSAAMGYAPSDDAGDPDVLDWLGHRPLPRHDATPPAPAGGMAFEDRAAPAVGAIARGDFDPQGANSTTFEGTPGMQAANAGIVPSPRPRPDAAGSPAGAPDDDEEETPATGLAAAGRPAGAPVMAFGPEGQPGGYRNLPDAIRRPGGGSEEPGFGLGLLSKNAKTGLLAAGLGMLASRSPFLGNAVGEGGLAGVSAYGAANEADRKAAQEAEKLSREANQKNIDNLLKSQSQAETSRHNRATEAKDFKPQLIHHTDPATGQEIYESYNPNTQQISPLKGAADSKPPEKFVSQAPPVEERRRAPAASPEARDESYLKWLGEHRPPGYADIVRGVADYEMDPNRVESLQKGQRSQLYRDAKLYDPTYDQTHFTEKTGVINSFSRGADRASVNSLNVAVSHLASLKDLGDALKNGQFPIVNRIFNQAGIQMGGQAVTNFNAAKEIVGDEVVKAIVGGVSAQADREAIKHLIMAQQSPEQLQGTINTFVDLLGGQLEGRRIGYQAGTGLINFDQKYLSQETREALTRKHSGGIDPNVARMVWPSGIPKNNGVAPAITPPSAARVRQNGIVYERQPDGNYKPVAP
jgi:hypothetical protein